MDNYLKYDRIRLSLVKKGFQEFPSKWVWMNQKGYITCISVDKKVLQLLEKNYPEFSKKIPENLFLNRESFKNLINDPLSKEDYYNHYIKSKLEIN